MAVGSTACPWHGCPHGPGPSIAPRAPRPCLAAAASHACARSARARSSRDSSTSRRSAGAASAWAASHASVAASVSGESWRAGNRPRTTSMPIWIDRSAHTRSITAKYFGRVRREQLPLRGLREARDRRLHQRVGQRVRLHDLRPRLRLDRRRGAGGQAADLVALAGRRVVAGEFGGERASRRRRPCAASGSRNAQRSSWSTSRPSIFAVPSSSPCSSWRSAAPTADRGEEPRPRQLVLAARLGQPQLPQRALGEQPSPPARASRAPRSG